MFEEKDKIYENTKGYSVLPQDIKTEALMGCKFSLVSPSRVFAWGTRLRWRAKYSTPNALKYTYSFEGALQDPALFKRKKQNFEMGANTNIILDINSITKFLNTFWKKATKENITWTNKNTILMLKSLLKPFILSYQIKNGKLVLGHELASEIKQDILRTLEKNGIISFTNLVKISNVRFTEEGLYSEQLFGPTVSFECSCFTNENSILITPFENSLNVDNYICPICNVEFIDREVRRARMGYIKLAIPISHPWYIMGNPSYLSLYLDLPNILVNDLIQCKHILGTLVDRPELDYFRTIFKIRRKSRVFTPINYQWLNYSSFNPNIYKKFKPMVEEGAEWEAAYYSDLIGYKDETFIEPVYEDEVLLNKFVALIKEDKQVRKNYYNYKTYAGLSWLSYYDQIWKFIELAYYKRYHLRLDSSVEFKELKRNRTTKRQQDLAPCKTLTGSSLLYYYVSYWHQWWIINLNPWRTFNFVLFGFKRKRKFGKWWIRLNFLKRVRWIHLFNLFQLNPTWMFLLYLPVLPPGLRPFYELDKSVLIVSDLTKSYRQILVRNKRAILLPNTNFHLLKIWNYYYLQKSIEVLFINTNTQNNLFLRQFNGKYGRFRYTLLGKRIEYSARSVITSGSHLNANAFGVPFKMAESLFRPFIGNRINEYEQLQIQHALSSPLLQGMHFFHKNLNLPLHSSLDIENDEDISHNINFLIRFCLNDLIQFRPLLINRAPTLHKLNLQAFSGRLLDSDNFEFYPAACSSFNADFDGDQTALFFPFSSEALNESNYILSFKQNYHSHASNKFMPNPSQDLVLGLVSLYSTDEMQFGSNSFYSNNMFDVMSLLSHNIYSLKNYIWIRLCYQAFWFHTAVFHAHSLLDNSLYFNFKRVQIRHAQKRLESVSMGLNNKIHYTPITWFIQILAGRLSSNLGLI